ncbi:MAG: sigma-70 family RNA polymerase sigma factor [Actinomycetota bacterium]|nr:sigma-70 family RNA polymerase sigma factor [Actinomycetota bacterium]
MRSEESNQDRVERFRAIYLDNYLPILGYALRRTSTPDDAADVVAETFLVLWRRLDRAPNTPETRPWLYGIARNVMANGQRSERRWTRLTARLRAEPVGGQTGDASPASDVVSKAMQQLSPADRELLRLAAWEDLTPGGLGAALGCSTNAAKTRLHRARRRFAQKVDLLGIQVKPRAPTGHVVVELPVTTDKEEEIR